GDIPPGWRDDEIVETTVHAALVQQGHWMLFFPQAEGHEPLYHYLSAAWITALGQSLFSVRLLSAFLGLLSVAALYRLARVLFGTPAALIAAAALAVSFWALMYARFKLRQVSELAPMLLAFYFFWRALHAGGPGIVFPKFVDWRGRPGPAVKTAATRARSRPSPTHSSKGEPPEGGFVPFITGTDFSKALRAALLGALFLAVALYTYYAARGAPLLLGAFAVYLLIFHRDLLRARWRPLALAAGVSGLLVLPLAVAIALTPQGEVRLAVVGAPLAEMLRGDPTAVLHNTALT